MKTKQFLVSFFMALACAFSIQAQKLENSTLWKISGNGLEQASYLFGTFHITCDATLGDDVKKALDETTQIVLELDMDDPSLQAKMMTNMYMSNNTKLSELVSKEDYVAIDSLFIKNLGMSVKFMDNVKPFFLTASLYPKMIDCPAESIEGELMKVAKTQNEEIKGLESIEDQMQVFEDIPYEDQVKDLVKSAKDNLAHDKQIFIKMMAMYKAEDITAMVEMMNDDDYTSISEHQNVLLDNRNKNWISKISEFAKEQPTFFGVGAAHLAGENGVIQLLRNQGYIVEAAY